MIDIFREYILHDIAAQIRLSFNHVTKEPWSSWRKWVKEYEFREYILHDKVKGSIV